MLIIRKMNKSVVALHIFVSNLSRGNYFGYVVHIAQVSLIVPLAFLFLTHFQTTDKSKREILNRLFQLVDIYILALFIVHIF